MKYVGLKEQIKKIPGLTPAYSYLKNAAGSLRNGEPGDYLFADKALSWLSHPDLKRQLPTFQRLFASVSSIKLSSNEITKRRVRQKAFKIVSRLTQLFSLQSSIKLQLPDHVVCINLLDPRCFKVVNEVMNGSERISKFISEGDTFVDVGANHGSYSVLASKMVGESGMVAAVEPQPNLAKLVHTSLSLNKKSKFIVQQIASGDKDCSLEFYVPAHNSGEGSIFQAFTKERDHNKIKVHMKRFDEAFDWNSFPGNILLKLDIEGGELSFFKGAREMIMARKPTIIMEINPFAMKAANIKTSDLTTQLKDLGYLHYIRLDDPGEVRSIESLDAVKQYDIAVIPSKA